MLCYPGNHATAAAIHVYFPPANHGGTCQTAAQVAKTPRHRHHRSSFYFAPANQASFSGFHPFHHLYAIFTFNFVKVQVANNIATFRTLPWGRNSATHSNHPPQHRQSAFQCRLSLILDSLIPERTISLSSTWHLNRYALCSSICLFCFHLNTQSNAIS